MEHLEKREPGEFTIPDFALDRSFIQWVKNKDPESEQFWSEWLMNHPEMEEKVEIARNFVLALQFHGECISSRQVDAEWKRLSQASVAFKTSDKKVMKMPGVFWKKGFISVAAALLFLLTFTFIGLLLVNRSNVNDAASTIVKSASSGQKISVTLADGTKVKLNSDSEIQYPAKFTGDAREVVLKGEAFFDVAHNESLPFRVRTSDVTVMVLGTSFNVNAYPESADTQVALEKGKVKVNIKGNEEIFLNPNEMLRVNRDDHSHQIQLYDPDETTGWRDGWVYIGKANFRNTIVKLERWFGVTFEIDPKFKIDTGWRFTGKFQNKSLAYILQSLSYPDLFKYRIEKQRVIIY